MPLPYSLSDERRAQLEQDIEIWAADELLHEVAIDLPASGARKQSKVGSYSGEEVRERAPSSFIDLVIGEHGTRGGRLQFRAVFLDESGKPAKGGHKRRTVKLIRSQTGGSDSTGRDAAIEVGFQTLAGNLDGSLKRLEHANDVVVGAIRDQARDTAAAMERTVTLMINHQESLLSSQRAVAELSVAYQKQGEIHDRDLQILRMELERPGLIEQFAPSVPGLVNGITPVLQGLAGWLGAQARALDSSTMAAHPQLYEGATPEPEPEPVEAPPIPTAEA